MLKFIPRDRWTPENQQGRREALLFRDRPDIRDLVPHYFGSLLVTQIGRTSDYRGHDMVDVRAASASVLVCERAWKTGETSVMEALHVPFSEQIWRFHVGSWRLLIHHMTRWVRAGFMPWDLQLQNLGRGTEARWLTLHFDVFDELDPTQKSKAIAASCWKALKRVLTSYGSLADRRQGEAWGRRVAFLRHPDHVWRTCFGPDSDVYRTFLFSKCVSDMIPKT